MASTPVCMSPETRIRFACHEAGHAVVAWMGGISALMSVSLPSKEFPAGKMDWLLRPSNNPLSQLEQLEDWIRDIQKGVSTAFGHGEWEVLSAYLAGLAGEGIGTGVVKTLGAGADLAYARETAGRIVKNNCVHDCPWGEDSGKSKVDIAGMYRTSPSYEVILVLNRAYRHARSVIKTHRSRFDAVVLGLISRSELSHDELSHILGRRP